MTGSGGTELVESIVHQLIDEEALGVAFEMHRAIKLGYYELVYPDDRYIGAHVRWQLIISCTFSTVSPQQQL